MEPPRTGGAPNSHKLLQPKAAAVNGVVKSHGLNMPCRRETNVSEPPIKALKLVFCL